MERVERMKTATTPLKNVRSKATALAVLATASLTTFGLGVAGLAHAQQAEEARTVATGSGIPLAADAPDRYTVKQGDTLWDISKVFLRDPWFWPEIWYVNPQVKNPHLIYPGDTLVLVKGGTGPQVMIAERGPEGAAAESSGEAPASGTGVTKLSPQVRSTPINAAVTTISYDTIATFLGRPTILNKNEVKSGPYVVAMRDDHVIGGSGSEIYARGVRDAVENTRFNLVHVGEPLRDPSNNRVLGYRGIYVGTGVVTGTGNPIKLLMHDMDREVLPGDKLFPEHVQLELDFLPRAPSSDVQGAAIVVNGVTVAGARDVIAINRGGKHGLEAGHVLAIHQKGEVVKDFFSEGQSTGTKKFWTGSLGHNVRLPDERIGLAMVFKTFENMSYALIMESSHPVRSGDVVRTP
jgi:LysM repeat protein